MIIIEEKLTMSAMYNPPHPSEIVADTVLRADGGISVTEFAKKLKMTRAAVTTTGGLDEWSFASYLNSTLRGSTKRPPRYQLQKNYYLSVTYK
jgi:phage antirepressor YoqD-like protein